MFSMQHPVPRMPDLAWLEAVQLAPYYVLWGFITLVLAGLSLGLLWLVHQRWVDWLFRQLCFADLGALWLGFGALYQRMILLPGEPELQAGERILWVGLAATLLVRLGQRRWQLDPWLMAIVVVIWGWSIGAGIQYSSALDEDLQLLRDDPVLVTQAENPRLDLLNRSLRLTRLPESAREQTRRLRLQLASVGPHDPAPGSIFRLLAVPALIPAIEADLRKLWAYQAVQCLLLAGWLLLWGFGGVPFGLMGTQKSPPQG